MTMTYPPVDELKAQAKRLRPAMTERGSEITHAAALELIARQYGARDWNTLSALAAKPNDKPGLADLRRRAYSRSLSEPAFHRQGSGTFGCSRQRVLQGSPSISMNPSTW